MRLIALTGATGFIGRALLRELPKRGYRVRALLRRPTAVPVECLSAVVGDLASPRNMADALADVDVVIHSAGVGSAVSGVPEDDYRAINTDATVALARAASRAGAKRFVFLSSIRAQAGRSRPDVLTEATEPRPTNAYGRSKLAAEQSLAHVDIDWVALRPVSVYGPGVRGNVAELLRLARSPYPMPLASLAGRRSLLAVDNLVDAIDVMISAPVPQRRPYIVADDGALSVAEMIAAIRAAAYRRAGLFHAPPFLLRSILRAAGKEDWYELAAASLIVDSGKLRALGWTPRIRTADGLAALAAIS